MGFRRPMGSIGVIWGGGGGGGGGAGLRGHRPPHFSSFCCYVNAFY